MHYPDFSSFMFIFSRTCVLHSGVCRNHAKPQLFISWIAEIRKWKRDTGFTVIMRTMRVQRQRVDCTRRLFSAKFCVKQSNIDWRLNCLKNLTSLEIADCFDERHPTRRKESENSKFCGPCDQFTHFTGRLCCRQSDRKSLYREWWESKKFTACLWCCGQFFCAAVFCWKPKHDMNLKDV